MNEIKLWAQCVFWDIRNIWETLCTYRSEMNSKMLYFIRELTQANHCCLIHVVWTNTGLFSTKGRREEVSFGSYRKRSLITWMMMSLIVAIELEMIRTLLLFDIYIIIRYVKETSFGEKTTGYYFLQHSRNWVQCRKNLQVCMYVVVWWGADVMFWGLFF